MIQGTTIKQVKNKLGEWCKHKRQQYDLSQEDLAKELEMSRLTIRKLEEGKNVTIDTVLKVVNHFDGLEAVYTAIETNIVATSIKSLY